MKSTKKELKKENSKRLFRVLSDVNINDINHIKYFTIKHQKNSSDERKHNNV